MKPTKQLILAFRETAKRIREQPDEYDWSTGAQCNCGILAQVLLGVTAEQLRKNHGVYGTWTKRAEPKRCLQTGLYVDTLLNALCSFGLEQKDFSRIENLDGEMGRSEPDAVAAWFDAEADRLERLRISQPFSEL